MIFNLNKLLYTQPAATKLPRLWIRMGYSARNWTGFGRWSANFMSVQNLVPFYLAKSFPCPRLLMVCRSNDPPAFDTALAHSTVPKLCGHTRFAWNFDVDFLGNQGLCKKIPSAWYSGGVPSEHTSKSVCHHTWWSSWMFWNSLLSVFY